MSEARKARANEPLHKEIIWRGVYRDITYSVKQHAVTRHMPNGIWCGYLHLNSSDHPELVDLLEPEYWESLPWHGGLTFRNARYDGEIVFLKVGCDFAHYDDLGMKMNEDLVEVHLKDVIDIHRERFPDKDHPKFLKALEEVEKERKDDEYDF